MRPDRAEVVAAVERSLAAILADGVDPNFPAPFELDRLADDADLQREIVQSAIDYIMHRGKRPEATASLHVMRMPKTSLFGYRYFAEIDLPGAVRYLATAILVARRIEAPGIPGAARRVFSHRFLSEGPAVFDASCDYGIFLGRTLEKLDLDRKTFLVSADIANFYPSIDDARLLRNLGARGVEPWLAETLGDMLSQWKPRWRQGLPVGPFASYLLADAAQLEIDAKLRDDGIDFIRYFDDYRIFADDLSSARLAVGKLIQHLDAENLTLNQAKTSVEAVTRPEYAAKLDQRRMLRFWNSLPPQGFSRLAQNSPAAVAPSSQSAPTGPIPAKGAPGEKGKAKNKNKDPTCDIYNRCSPFKKSQLDELDLAFLDRIEPVAQLAKLKTQAAEGGLVRLGDFRTLIESACYRENHALIGETLSLLDNNPLSMIYLADVLIEERTRIPEHVRTLAADWFAARLLSQDALSDHEVMTIAVLLGVEGYRRPDSIRAYLESDAGTTSSTALRALLAALRDDCDTRSARALLQICSRTDEPVRRAIFDISWPHLDRDERARIVLKYTADFRADPFLRALARSAGVATA